MQRLITLSMAFMVAPALGQSTENEYRSSFRPGHNITVAAGLQQSRWSLNLQSLEKPLTTERFNFLTSLIYSYHFQIFQLTGFALGTSLSLIVDRTSLDGFEPQFGLILPSLLAGFVQNIGANSRLLLLGEFGSVWYPYFKWKVAQNRAQYDGAVPDQFSMSAQLELGLQNRNAVALIAGWRLAADQLVGEKSALGSETTGFPSVRHEGWYLAVGMTRQVTETLTGVQGER